MSSNPTTPRFEGASFIIESGDNVEVYDAKFLVAALCVYVAESDGNISQAETEEMLNIVGNHFKLESAESLSLLTRAMSELADNPDLMRILKELAESLSPQDKEEIALMLLKVVAADGRKLAEEIDALATAAEIIDIDPDLVHSAFDRYFTDTQIGQ
ncbi:MAG: TerB family tellurite resistance protein [Gammaproteobacteria bacterium]|nr:TerB family tellurite resistance protein [Gammaproteobacteria bacterium]